MKKSQNANLINNVFNGILGPNITLKMSSNTMKNILDEESALMAK